MHSYLHTDRGPRARGRRRFAAPAGGLLAMTQRLTNNDHTRAAGMLAVARPAATRTVRTHRPHVPQA